MCTPGRLLDFCDDEYVDLREVRMLVLDEADRMLDLGFEPPVERFVRQRGKIPTEENGRQTLLFSATFFTKSAHISIKIYARPSPYRARISVGHVGALARGVTQKLVGATDGKELKEYKFPLLLELIESRNKSDEKTMVFCKQVKTANWLKERLSSSSSSTDSDSDSTKNSKKITVEVLRGDLTQGARLRALEAFREGQISLLVTTDIASRGLDIPLVEHVINFDLPTDRRDFEEYVHRLGRTGSSREESFRKSTSLYVAGFEDEVGNGPIYKQLRDAFKESGDSLPDWFVNHVDGNEDKAKRPQNRQRREQEQQRQRTTKECHGEEGGENKEVLLDLVVVEVAIGAAIIVVVAIAKEGEDTNAVKR